ncbi:hypothetical protein ACFL3V_01315 [Nanoarchaeota archaeon]
MSEGNDDTKVVWDQEAIKRWAWRVREMWAQHLGSKRLPDSALPEAVLKHASKIDSKAPSWKHVRAAYGGIAPLVQAVEEKYNRWNEDECAVWGWTLREQLSQERVARGEETCSLTITDIVNGLRQDEDAPLPETLARVYGSDVQSMIDTVEQFYGLSKGRSAAQAEEDAFETKATAAFERLDEDRDTDVLADSPPEEKTQPLSMIASAIQDPDERYQAAKSVWRKGGKVIGSEQELAELEIHDSLQTPAEAHDEKVVTLVNDFIYLRQQRDGPLTEEDIETHLGSLNAFNAVFHSLNRAEDAYQMGQRHREQVTERKRIMGRVQLEEREVPSEQPKRLRKIKNTLQGMTSEYSFTSRDQIQHIQQDSAEGAKGTTLEGVGPEQQSESHPILMGIEPEQALARPEPGELDGIPQTVVGMGHGELRDIPKTTPGFGAESIEDANDLRVSGGPNHDDGAYNTNLASARSMKTAEDVRGIARELGYTDVEVGGEGPDESEEHEAITHPGGKLPGLVSDDATEEPADEDYEYTPVTLPQDDQPVFGQFQDAFQKLSEKDQEAILDAALQNGKGHADEPTLEDQMHEGDNTEDITVKRQYTAGTSEPESVEPTGRVGSESDDTEFDANPDTNVPFEPRHVQSFLQHSIDQMKEHAEQGEGPEAQDASLDAPQSMGTEVVGEEPVTEQSVNRRFDLSATGHTEEVPFDQLAQAKQGYAGDIPESELATKSDVISSDPSGPTETSGTINISKQSADPGDKSIEAKVAQEPAAENGGERERSPTPMSGQVYDPMKPSDTVKRAMQRQIDELNKREAQGKTVKKEKKSWSRSKKMVAAVAAGVGVFALGGAILYSSFTTPDKDISNMVAASNQYGVIASFDAGTRSIDAAVDAIGAVAYSSDAGEGMQTPAVATASAEEPEPKVDKAEPKIPGMHPERACNLRLQMGFDDVKYSSASAEQDLEDYVSSMLKSGKRKFKVFGTASIEDANDLKVSGGPHHDDGDYNTKLAEQRAMKTVEDIRSIARNLGYTDVEVDGEGWSEKDLWAKGKDPRSLAQNRGVFVSTDWVLDPDLEETIRDVVEDYSFGEMNGESCPDGTGDGSKGSMNQQDNAPDDNFMPDIDDSDDDSSDGTEAYADNSDSIDHLTGIQRTVVHDRMGKYLDGAITWFELREDVAEYGVPYITGEEALQVHELLSDGVEATDKVDYAVLSSGFVEGAWSDEVLMTEVAPGYASERLVGKILEQVENQQCSNDTDDDVLFTLDKYEQLKTDKALAEADADDPDEEIPSLLYEVSDDTVLSAGFVDNSQSDQEEAIIAELLPAYAADKCVENLRAEADSQQSSDAGDSGKGSGLLYVVSDDTVLSSGFIEDAPSDEELVDEVLPGYALHRRVENRRQDENRRASEVIEDLTKDFDEANPDACATRSALSLLQSEDTEPDDYNVEGNGDPEYDSAKVAAEVKEMQKQEKERAQDVLADILSDVDRECAKSEAERDYIPQYGVFEIDALGELHYDYAEFEDVDRMARIHGIDNFGKTVPKHDFARWATIVELSKMDDCECDEVGGALYGLKEIAQNQDVVALERPESKPNPEPEGAALEDYLMAA